MILLWARVVNCSLGFAFIYVKEKLRIQKIGCPGSGGSAVGNVQATFLHVLFLLNLHLLIEITHVSNMEYSTGKDGRLNKDKTLQALV